MTTAYLIAGPPSSGNRLVASIFARSGCLGVGSCDQPTRTGEIPEAADRPLVIIKHRKINRWALALYAAGYKRVVVVVVVREPIANARSLVDHGHVVGFSDAQSLRISMIARNIVAGMNYADRLEVITYEGLTEEFLSAWLPEIGLPYAPGPLDLPDQDTPASITNQNARHYSECQA